MSDIDGEALVIALRDARSISDAKIARRFKVAKLEVKSWREGQDVPHHVVCGILMSWLREEIASKHVKTKPAVRSGKKRR
ncbi:MAG: hypothetical protein WCJ29_03970 [bacterium]